MSTEQVSVGRQPTCREEAFIYDLLALHEARRTGVMTVRAEAVTIDIYLREGIPVFAERDTLGGSLGRVLLRDGAIAESQYEAVVQQMTQELFESEQMRFAEVAVALGILTHEQVNLHLEQQVRASIVECIAYREPEVTFRADDVAVAGVVNYPCPVPPLVLNGVKSYFDPARAEAVWRPDARAFANLRAPASETAARYALQPDERRFISDIDGSRRIEEAIHTNILDTLHASQIFAALLLTDGVQLYERAHARVALEGGADAKPLQPVQSTSVQRRLSSPLLRAARARKMTPAAPVVEQRPASEAQAGTSERRLQAAERRLRERQADAAQRQAQAERMFIQGKRLLKSEALPRALRSFSIAARLDPSSAEYALCEKWTEFLLRPPANPQATLLKLNQLASNAIKHDKSNALAHYVFGRVAHARGDERTARLALKAALKFDPSNSEAKTFLRALLRR